MQNDLWKEEGTAWYRRNREALTYDRTGYADPLMMLAEWFELRPKTIADIGCSNGWRAASLAACFGAKAAGVDLSVEAILAGRKLYPGVHLLEGSATDIPLADDSADLVLCSYLLHCLSRESLLLAASEIDRILWRGGHLLLSDFSPDHPTAVPWHHRPGIQTFKLPQAGAGIFLATGNYRLVASLSYDHDTHRLASDVPSERRGACVLLRKESQYVNG